LVTFSNNSNTLNPAQRDPASLTKQNTTEQTFVQVMLSEETGSRFQNFTRSN